MPEFKTTKKCVTCKRSLKLAAFSGQSTKCRVCWKTANRKSLRTRRLGEVRDSYNKTVRERMRKRKATKVCYMCGQPKLPNATYCEKHFLTAAAGRVMRCGSTVNAIGLKKQLVKQNYKCPYTGELLILGVNASLDHIKPASRFPELIGTLSNMEWVSKEVNRIKGAMTKEEFISFCHMISKKFKGRKGVSR